MALPPFSDVPQDARLARGTADSDAGFRARLARLAERLEERFQGFARGLEPAALALDALVENLEFAGSAADGREALAEVLSGLEALAERQDAEAELVRRRADLGPTLAAECEEMRRALAYLRAFAFTIKVTAGGVRGGLAEFAAFSDELHAAVTDASRHLDALDADLTRLPAPSAPDSPAPGGGEPRRLVAELSQAAAAAVARQDKLAVLAGQVARLARGVRARLDQATDALQARRPAALRLSHVDAGLDLLAHCGFGEGARARVAPAVRRLLAAQIEGAAADLDAELAPLETCLAAFAPTSDEVARVADWAARQADSAGVDRLAELLNAAGDLCAAAGAAEADASLEALTASLGAHLRGIRQAKSTIQHMATNAHLKCSRLGDAGRPIAVIAVELRVKADDLDRAALAAEAALAGLRPLAHGIDPAELRVRLALAAERSGGRGSLAGLAASASAAAETLTAAAAQPELRRAAVQAMRSAAASLALRAGDLDALHGSDAEALQILLARLSRRYTLPGEREIHERFAASARNATAARAA